MCRLSGNQFPLATVPRASPRANTPPSGTRWGRGPGNGRHVAGRERRVSQTGTGRSPQGLELTFLVHFLTVLISSCITRSTLFREGPFSFTICFLTIASKAMSGVNSPVLYVRKSPHYIRDMSAAKYWSASVLIDRSHVKKACNALV